MGTISTQAYESSRRRRRATFSVVVAAGAAAAVAALAMSTAVPSAQADRGTFSFQVPTLTSQDPVIGSYDVPNYQADGSFSPFSYTDQPLAWVSDADGDRYFDPATSTAWEQLNMGPLEIQAFTSPLMIDGTVYDDAMAMIASVLFNTGGFTLFGLQYDSAHELLNILGPGAAELFSIPTDLGFGASLDDVLTGAVGTTDPVDAGDLLGGL